MIFDELEVSVEVGEEKLDEYDTVTKDNEMACWIASEQDKEFTVTLANNSVKESMSFAVHIDGRIADDVVLNPGEDDNSIGVVIDPQTVLPYLFSRIQLCDDDALPSESLESLGTIRIVVRRTEESKEVEWEDSFDVPEAIGPIHERTKKGGTHCISLGQAVTVQTDSWISLYAEDIDTLESPYRVLLFRYRPKDILQAQGIISGPPEVLQTTQSLRKEDDKQQTSASKPKKRPRNEVKQEFENEDDSDSATLQAELAAATVILESLKARMAKNEDRRRQKRLKREPSPINVDAIKGVIDLTSD